MTLPGRIQRLLSLRDDLRPKGAKGKGKSTLSPDDEFVPTPRDATRLEHARSSQKKSSQAKKANKKSTADNAPPAWFSGWANQQDKRTKALEKTLRQYEKGVRLAPIIDISLSDEEEEEDDRSAESLGGMDPYEIPLAQDAPPLPNKRTRSQRTPPPSLQPPRKRGRPRKNEEVERRGAE
jgi:hypothetical protein